LAERIPEKGKTKAAEKRRSPKKSHLERGAFRRFWVLAFVRPVVHAFGRGSRLNEVEDCHVFPCHAAPTNITTGASGKYRQGKNNNRGATKRYERRRATTSIRSCLAAILFHDRSFSFPTQTIMPTQRARRTITDNDRIVTEMHAEMSRRGGWLKSARQSAVARPSKIR